MSLSLCTLVVVVGNNFESVSYENRCLVNGIHYYEMSFMNFVDTSFVTPGLGSNVPKSAAGVRCSVQNATQIAQYTMLEQSARL